ncbi:uncharacterized protein LOC134675553 isoform X2 [Cydia fagiglandana]|uniref:uncharacterized protein LOC134675553 isoform X2 n=1 Tax=Cydia fagiglandana TaxID=1458189 RepID=UPI002FEE32FF
MVGCSIRNCKSRSEKGSIIGFYSFPKKESVANEWLRYCGLKTTCKNGRVCSKHFTSSDYIKSLRHILMKESPRTVRKLKPDAIPTLHIDSIEKSNSTDLTAKSTVCTGGQTDNCESKENYNMPAPSCNINSKAEVHIKSESDTTDPSCNINLKAEVHIKSESDTTDPSCNINSKAEVHIKSESDTTDPSCNINSKAEVHIKSESDTTDPSCNINLKAEVHIKSESDTTDITPANNVEGSSNVVEGSSNKITVSEVEYKLLKRKVDEYEILKNNLKQIFTSGQIRCLTKPDRQRVKWSAEDIAAAISLRSISPKGYQHLRDTVGIPLPASSTLCKWASKFDIKSEAEYIFIPCDQADSLE